MIASGNIIDNYTFIDSYQTYKDFLDNFLISSWFNDLPWCHENAYSNIEKGFSLFALF